MDETPHISIKVDGYAYTLRPGDLSARDAGEVRRATGTSLRSLMEAAAKDPDLDVIAAIVWLARRQRGETALSYDDVAKDIGYDVKIETDSEPVEEDPDSPEA